MTADDSATCETVGGHRPPLQSNATFCAKHRLPKAGWLRQQEDVAKPPKLAQTERFFDLLAEDIIVDYAITVPGYPRRVQGREAVAELYRHTAI